MVDSGGAGVVYSFDGVCKYLNGEEVEAPHPSDDGGDAPYVDYTRFNRDSDFSLGYCTELLQDFINYHKTDIVSGIFVFAAGISQSDYQHNA